MQILPGFRCCLVRSSSLFTTKELPLLIALCDTSFTAYIQAYQPKSIKKDKCCSHNEIGHWKTKRTDAPHLVSE